MSNGHFVISVGDDIWVIVMTHRVAIIVKSLAIWQRIVRIAIIIGSLVILLEIVLSKGKFDQKHSNARVYALTQGEVEAGTFKVVAG